MLALDDRSSKRTSSQAFARFLVPHPTKIFCSAIKDMDHTVEQLETSLQCAPALVRSFARFCAHELVCVRFCAWFCVHELVCVHICVGGGCICV